MLTNRYMTIKDQCMIDELVRSAENVERLFQRLPEQISPDFDLGMCELSEAINNLKEIAHELC